MLGGRSYTWKVRNTVYLAGRISGLLLYPVSSFWISRISGQSDIRQKPDIQRIPNDNFCGLTSPKMPQICMVIIIIINNKMIYSLTAMQFRTIIITGCQIALGPTTWYIHKIDPGTGHNELFDRCFDKVFENGQITYSIGFIGNRTPFNAQYRAHGQLARALHKFDRY
jgi:hypothetical protein